MSEQQIESKTMKACVTGGTGYMASLLIKHLLQRGYSVNTTARDIAFPTKIAHLLDLQNLGELNIFQADLTDDGSFENPISGCDVVFHVATPIDFASQDPENDMIKPAIQGTLNVLKACTKARTVKRVIMTSSVAAVSINKINCPDELVMDENYWRVDKINSSDELVMDENNWSDVEFLSSERPPTWGYPVSKTLAEKEAWKYAEENSVDLITVIPPLMAGPSITPKVPTSICLAMSLLTGNEFLINGLKGMQMLSGSISLTHVEDVVRAHVFLAEKEFALGRYICCAVNTSVPKLAGFLSKRYPEYKVPTEFGDFPGKAKLILSSEKLVQQGFSFEYGIEDIYDESIGYLKKVGLLEQ
ncbi:hypothetical protein ACHQM5_003788 [Ranunculus cassubicifolius]